VDGEYRIKVRLRRQYQDYIMGMGWPQQLDIRVDGRLVKRLLLGGKPLAGRPQPVSRARAIRWRSAVGKVHVDGRRSHGDSHGGEGRNPEWLVWRSFRELWEPEGVPQPQQRGRVLTNDEVYMGYAGVDSVQIGGPYQTAGLAKDTPSRREIFVCQPRSSDEETGCAGKILSRLGRRAYRRPVTERDMRVLLDFFAIGRRDGKSFDAGIQFALERLLVDPEFLVRVERDPPQVAPVSDLELASRLSFFCGAAFLMSNCSTWRKRGSLAIGTYWNSKCNRMLADPKAVDSLVNGFAAQWLNVRRVAEVVVDPRFYPNFDESLLQAFQQGNRTVRCEHATGRSQCA